MQQDKLAAPIKTWQLVELYNAHLMLSRNPCSSSSTLILLKDSRSNQPVISYPPLTVMGLCMRHNWCEKSDLSYTYLHLHTGGCGWLPLVQLAEQLLCPEVIWRTQIVQRLPSPLLCLPTRFHTFSWTETHAFPWWQHIKDI